MSSGSLSSKLFNLKVFLGTPKFIASWSDVRVLLWKLFPQTLQFDKLIAVGVRVLGRLGSLDSCDLNLEFVLTPGKNKDSSLEKPDRHCLSQVISVSISYSD